MFKKRLGELTAVMEFSGSAFALLHFEIQKCFSRLSKADAFLKRETMGDTISNIFMLETWKIAKNCGLKCTWKYCVLNYHPGRKVNGAAN